MNEEASRDRERLQIERLAAGIAHEINTPLQYIGDNLEFLRRAFASLRYPCGGEGCGPHSERGALSSEVPEAVAAAREGVEAIARIVQTLKDGGTLDGKGTTFSAGLPRQAPS